MRKLDFFCAGFAKSGTTTLYNILKQHPQIYLSEIKEPVFWNDKTALQRGVKWYLNRYYREASDSQVVGEINPQVTNGAANELLIKRVLKKNGKIIFIMRNPIDRLYSHFFMDLLWGNFYDRGQNVDLVNYDKMFDQFVEKTFRKFYYIDMPRIFDINQFAFGKYSYYLERYRRVFGSDNVFIIIFEEFIQNIQKSSMELFAFLNINRGIKLNFDIKSNEGNFLPKNVMSMRINDKIYNIAWPFICRNVDINHFVDRMLDEKLNWNMRSNKVLLDPVKRKDMSTNTRSLLQKIFVPEIERVEELLGRTLEGCWY